MNKLDEAREDLNHAIALVERSLYLRFRGQCRRAMVPFHEDPRYALSWDHDAGTWGLFVTDPQGQRIRLRSAPPEIRVAATYVLQDLLDALQGSKTPVG